MVLISVVQLRTDSRCVAIFKSSIRIYRNNRLLLAKEELLNGKMKNKLECRTTDFQPESRACVAIPYPAPMVPIHFVRTTEKMPGATLKGLAKAFHLLALLFFCHIRCDWP